ncbi:Fructosamine/Ketosamine-3-kinase [Achaetomium macrosporum]|uniref:protein-ribulosamine 3-kinase n=1 Tax=Achaetomium macrosporum TaxID=79813 RepID=A0AAN7CC46_9PEZI|nr:Fructosamine/Ketosamine-3-kinase [Achaetomium macrosporum]
MRIDVVVGDKEKSVFVKLIEREEFVGMAEAEYEGQKAISAMIPNHAIEPIAWGYYEGDRTKSWFLTHFRRLDPNTPAPSDLLPIVKTLHNNSRSPTGKFGFHITAFFGPPPMAVDWTDNWEEFWTREFRVGLAYAQRMLGDDPELQDIADEFIEKVVPRLLRPLQTGGRSIRPSLCHGDLWDGNIQIDMETGEPVLFDPCPFYGHCEMDLQCIRADRYTVGLNFVRLYKTMVGASEPAEDFDDRNALYAM